MDHTPEKNVQLLRERLAKRHPAISEALTDAQLSGMFEESREEFGDNCTPDEHVENAIKTARWVTEELGLLE